MHIDKLHDIVNKCNISYHRIVKMKHVDVKPSMYIEFNKENNKEGPKFKVVDHLRISTYRNIFAKGYVPNLSVEFFVIKKVKNTVQWTLLEISKVKKSLERFTKENCKKTN